jgi:hypothetical protein
LTRGIELPILGLHEQHLRIIAEYIFGAWTDLLTRHYKILSEGNEAEVSTLLETRLLRLVDEDHLWGQLVRIVAKGKETISFDGTHIEKRPDFSLYLSCRSAKFPLAVECKILDDPKSKSGKLYCDKGLARFLAGEYGWATREAIMIGYVRDKSTTASCLMPLLGAAKGQALPYAAEGPLAAVDLPPLDLARSSHGRKFKYPLRQPPADEPGPIALWHLWLPVKTKNAAKAKGASAS